MKSSKHFELLAPDEKNMLHFLINHCRSKPNREWNGCIFRREGFSYHVEQLVPSSEQASISLEQLPPTRLVDIIANQTKKVW